MYPVFWCILARTENLHLCQRLHGRITCVPIGTHWHPVAHISRAGTTLQETQNREADDEKHCDDGEVLVMVMVVVMVVVMMVAMMVVMVLFDWPSGMVVHWLLASG